MHYLKTEGGSAPEITWSLLFPEKLYHLLGFETQRSVLTLLPPQLRTLDGKDLAFDYSKASVSRFFNANSRDGSYSVYLGIKQNIIRSAKNGDFAVSGFSDSAAVAALIGAIRERFGQCAAVNTQAVEDYRRDIEDLIRLIASAVSDNTPAKYRGLKAKGFVSAMAGCGDTAEKLACLILIASTWYFWRSYPAFREDADALAPLVLPGAGLPESSEPGRSADFIADDVKKGRELLAAAESAYHNRDYRSCGDTCRRLIRLNFAEDRVLGKAYYLLVKCCRDHLYSYRGFYDPARFIRLAISYGCAEARSEWKTRFLDSIRSVPQPAGSFGKAREVVCNCANECSEACFSTLPAAFSGKSGFFTAETPEELASLAVEKPGALFLLARGDQGRNFRDLITLLDFFKQRGRAGAAELAPRICVRLDEEKYAPLVDTALRHMDGVTVPIHIIDDAKLAAQRLLSRHPLFYPIRSIGSDALSRKKTVIAFTIVSAGASALTERLIREAFWMGCFRYPGVTLSITLLSPDAARTESALRLACPGLFDRTWETDPVSGVELHFESVDIRSQALVASLEKLADRSNAFMYFAVDAGAGAEGLGLGVRIREWCVRRAVKTGGALGKAASPVIAFYCADDDTAHLAGSMVVQLEEYGNSWYNDYSLIPFGMVSERYGYGELSGGYDEKAAQCAHLGYCGVRPGGADADEALEEYFLRTYNRDSSRAAALSIPYRLFQVPAISPEEGGSFRADHITPTGWSITNADAFTDDAALEAMAEQFRSGIRRGELTEQLTVCEHIRWCRWILSRGWHPASADDVIAYIKAGNPGQQLYIARAHGCICPFPQLRELQKKLYEYYENSGDERFSGFAPSGEGERFDRFIAPDRQSVIDTPELMTLAWFNKKE